MITVMHLLKKIIVIWDPLSLYLEEDSSSFLLVKELKMKYFQLVTVVWGAPYIETFLNTALPSLLAPRNIPAMIGDIPVKYRIYTSSQDISYLQKSTICELANKYVDLELCTDLVDHLLEENTDKRKLFNLCYEHIIKEINLNDGAFVQLLPDLLYSDGSLSTIAMLAKSGKRLILGPSAYRSYKNIILPKVIAKYALDDGSISILTKDLCGLSRDGMLQSTTQIFWYNYSRLTFHWGVYWNVKNQGILQRSYCNLPVLIYPEDKKELPAYNGLSIEGTEYLEKAVPNTNDVYVIEDADEFLALDMENHPVINDFSPLIPNNSIRHFTRIPSIIETALVGKNYIKGSYARNYLKSRIRYRYGNDSEMGRKEYRESRTDGSICKP